MIPILLKDQQKCTFMASTVTVFVPKAWLLVSLFATFFVGHHFYSFLMGMVYQPLFFFCLVRVYDPLFLNRFWSSSQNGGCADFQWKKIIVTAFLRLIEVYEPQRGPICWFSKRPRPNGVLSFWTKTHNAKRKKKGGNMGVLFIFFWFRNMKFRDWYDLQKPYYAYLHLTHVTIKSQPNASRDSQDLDPMG